MKEELSDKKRKGKEQLSWVSDPSKEKQAFENVFITKVMLLSCHIVKVCSCSNLIFAYERTWPIWSMSMFNCEVGLLWCFYVYKTISLILDKKLDIRVCT